MHLEGKRLFGTMCCLHALLVRKTDSVLSEYGLNGMQLHTMIFVHLKNIRGENVCQRDIERETGLRPSSVSSMLSNLERSSFIIRTPAEEDARTKYITLTSKGCELCEKNYELMNKGDEIIQDALTEEEQIELSKLLKKMITHIKKQ